MKAGWKTVKLGDVCHVYQPETLSQKQLKDGPYPVYGANGQIGFHNEFNHAKPQLTLGCRGTCGAVNWTTENAWINGNAMVVKADEERVTPQFLTYALKGGINIGDSISGTAQPQITRKSLTPIEIPLPPLPEQKRIVALLDEAFAGIDEAKTKAEETVKEARNIFESHVQSVFAMKGAGWIEKTLKEVCEKITDGTHQTPKYFDSGVVFLSSRNVTSGKIDWDNVKYIDTKQHLEMHKRVAPRLGDILLAKNGTTGVAAIVDRNTTFDIYVSLALLRALPLIRPRLLLFFINSASAKAQFNKRIKGVGVSNLHLEEIREVALSFPANIKAQDCIVSELDEINEATGRLHTIYRQKIEKLIELKASLLAQAFAGELTA